jgi:O-antigen/teichoic acid export membrane protein
MDIIILSKVAPTGSVGNYGAALNLVSPVFIIISFFMVALFPFLSENHKDIAKLSKMFYWMVLLFLIVALPGVFMLYHLAPLITIVLPNFSSLVSVFQILVFSILTGFLVNLCITFLAALDKQDIGAAISFMLMVLVIPATIYLSMSFQEHGAAYARLLIEFVSGITSVYIMGKFIKLNITKVLILLFASAVAFIPTLFFPIVLPFGIAFYAFVASIIIDKEDRHYLLSLIHKR